MKPWLIYSVIRVAIFGVALTVLLILQAPGWLAAIIAAIIGMTVSYLFFRPQRDAVTKTVYDRRTGKTQAPSDDEDAEDGLENGGYLPPSALGSTDLEGDGPRKN